MHRLLATVALTALLVVPVRAEAQLVLGGLNLARASTDETSPGVDESSTEVGLNVGGGVSFESVGGGIRPIVGAKIEIDSGEGFVAFAGIGFPVG